MDKKPRRGRRPKDPAEKSARVLITIAPELDAKAQRIGGGCRSKGIAIAVQQHQDK